MAVQMQVVSTALDGSLTFWNIKKPEPMHTRCAAHSGAATCVACSGRGHVATGGLDGFVKLWNLNTFELLSQCRSHSGPVTCIAFSEDGRSLASGGTSGDMRTWHIQ